MSPIFDRVYRSRELNLSFGERYSFLHDTSARANSVLTPTAVPHQGSYNQSLSCSLLLEGTLWALVEKESHHTLGIIGHDRSRGMHAGILEELATTVR
jgi:hypothetical protein